MPPVTLPQAFALAQQHHAAGRFAEAEAIYRQILTVSPHNTDALNFLGIIAAHTGRPDLAIELMQRSIALQPGNAAYHDNFGSVLRDMGRMEEAIICSRRALALDPNEPISHHNLANALQDKGLLTEAIISYERAIALAPDYASAHLGLGRALVDVGLVDRAVDAYRRVIEIDPSRMDSHSALLMGLHYLDDVAPEVFFDEHRRWNQTHAQPLLRERLSHTNEPSTDRRLRVGYVSPDFRAHPVAFFMENLLASHDRAAVEVFCYASTDRPDVVTSRIRQHADHWRDIFPLDDAQAAALVRDDQIDILVDLAGHTADHRLLVFARRPAPVQVTYLGYCDTTGLDGMDYLLTDCRIDPEGADTRLASEKLVRLPDAWTCYRPPDDAPDVGPLPALRHGHVTFASYHTLAKLNETLLEWWAQILVRVPDSRLLFAAFGLQDDGARGRLRDFFAARGVSAERLEFRGWQTQRGYLEMHKEVDILLDSHPFSGHTVSCHALWMGVPPVTLTGTRPCGRLVTSVLHNAGLPELIAQSPDEYMRIAVDLATDQPRLAALRAALREQTPASPLMDAPRFARAVEAAYRQMWQAWCAQDR